MGVLRAAQLTGCAERGLTPCHHLLRHLVVAMRWSTEWEIDSHLFRQHLSATRSHRAKNGLRVLSNCCGAAAPRQLLLIVSDKRAHGCNLFLVRVNNFWMWRCGQAEAAVHHLGANNYFLTSVHSLSSGIHFISELQRKWQYRRRCNNRPAQGGQAFGAFSVDAFVCESPNLWRFLGLYRPLNQNSNTVTGYYHVGLAVTVQRNTMKCKTGFAGCWNFDGAFIY